MASTITIIARPEGYSLTLKTLSYHGVLFKVKGNISNSTMKFTIPYYKNNKNDYKLVEMAFQVNRDFRQEVLPNGCLEFTYR